MKEESVMSILSNVSKWTTAVAMVLLLLGLPAFAQFTSGSSGSDGALSFPAPAAGQTTTVIFNPASFSPPLDPSHNNIFNFTTITIPAGVTVKLVSSTLAAGPVVWLATGAVDIEGTLDLSGAQGHPFENPPIQSLRTPAAPGPGGYAGGVGGNNSMFTVESGLGPGGGAPNTTANLGGACSAGGTFTGNSFLVPLFGGSGGGGTTYNASTGFGAGGGGGGGAILIASSVSTTVNGTISANGGAAGIAAAGGGAGGAIRLMAQLIQGNGNLSAQGGVQNQGCALSSAGGPGAVRLEAFQQQFTGNFQGATVTSGSPFNTFLPSAPPVLTVTTVGGVAVNPLPTGSFQTPDVTINFSGPVTVALTGANIPLGTVVTLEFYSENGPDIIIKSTPLAGTLASSTATAQVTLPSGFTRGFIFASF
jgi:hypothetical protein